ncbi:MAG: metal ABC transporter substrate-binding protein [Oscillospiraceae bacterium]|nr:metal ABC transporter substrate-binding protein [Oscillospiraceae bacterium]
MFRRFISVIAVAMMALLCGCTGAESGKPKGKLQIITTIFPAYDFARAVFGDTADITLLLTPGAESHSYDPSARDIVKIDNCDLFIYNGGESDSWVDTMLKSTSGVNTLRMMDSVEALEEDELENGENHEEHEDEEYDEHIWTSPKNAALIVESVKSAAVQLNPEKSAFYEQRAGDYVQQINDLDKRFSELLKGEERHFVFGDRFPLLYFFREYDLNYYAAFPGCGSETEPSAQVVAFLAEKLKDSDTVDSVFHIELSNHKLADNLANENGLPTAEFHTCHNITADDFAAGESYVSLMERNYKMLKSALNGG